MNKLLVLVGKGVAYPVILLTVVYFIVRIALPFTLGMASDMVIFATPLVGILGLLLVLWLLSVLAKDFIKSLN